jgi:hypothetical protein
VRYINSFRRRRWFANGWKTFLVGQCATPYAQYVGRREGAGAVGSVPDNLTRWVRWLRVLGDVLVVCRGDSGCVTFFCAPHHSLPFYILVCCL